MGATPSGATGGQGQGGSNPAAVFPSAQPTGGQPASGSANPSTPSQGDRDAGAGGQRDPKTGQFTSQGQGQGGVKPIPPKPRPRLPGVRPDLPADSPLSELPDFVKPLARQLEQQRQIRSEGQRDSEPTPPPPDQTTQPAESDPANPDPAASTKPFQFAKRTWKGGQQEAEQSYLSMQGTFKANAAKASQYEAANDSASRWKQVAIQLGYREDGSHQAGPGGSAGRTAPNVQGQPRPGSSPAAGSAPESIDAIFEGLDLGLYNSISEQQGPHVAALWLVREALKQSDTYHQSQLAKVQAPFQNFQQQQQVAGAASNLIDTARQVEVPGPDGQLVPMYPELDDPVALRGIAEIWPKLGFSESQRLTPVALHMAVLAYRDYQRLYAGGDGSGAQGNGLSSAASNPGGQGQPSAADQIAAEITQQLTGGGGQVDPISGASLPLGRSSGNPRLDEADSVRREIRDARVPDPVLGFVTSASWKKNKR